MASSEVNKIFKQMACIEAGIAFDDIGSRYSGEYQTSIDEWLASLPEAERTIAKRKFRKLWRQRAKKLYPKQIEKGLIRKPIKRDLAADQALILFNQRREAAGGQG